VKASRNLLVSLKKNVRALSKIGFLEGGCSLNRAEVVPSASDQSLYRAIQPLEENPMNYLRIAAPLALLLGLTGLFVVYTGQGCVDLDFQVSSVVYEERLGDQANVSLLISLYNDCSEPLNLRGLTLTTFFGGYELGSDSLGDVVKIGARSVSQITFSMTEVWADVPLSEPFLSFGYRLEADAVNLLGSERVVIHLDEHQATQGLQKNLNPA